jgi:hypothetical protein
MNLPDQTTLLTVETAQQMRQAAKAMRDLAFGLEQYASEPSFSAINKIGRDLNRMGWNSLYTSLLLGDLADLMQEETHGEQEKADDVFQNLDALFTAVNYFSRSLTRITAMKIDKRTSETARVHLLDLQNRLKEVARECKSI